MFDIKIMGHATKSAEKWFRNLDKIIQERMKTFNECELSELCEMNALQRLSLIQALRRTPMNFEKLIWEKAYKIKLKEILEIYI